MLVLRPDAKAQYTPESMAPIKPYDHSGAGYHEVVFKTLIKDPWPSLWMMVRPSFRVEYAVILRKIEDNGYRFHYELEYAVAEEHIWNWTDINDSVSILDLRENVGVARKTAIIPNEIAERILNIWSEVLKKKTRYSEKELLLADGVVYEFYIRPYYFAGTWSPEAGLPKIMVDCGELLIQYVTAEEDDRDGILGQIDELLKSIRSEIY